MLHYLINPNAIFPMNDNNYYYIYLIGSLTKIQILLQTFRVQFDMQVDIRPKQGLQIGWFIART